MTETAMRPEFDQTSRLKEAIAQAGSVTLEVGPGPRPIVERKRFADPNSVYVGWNIDYKQHEDLVERNLRDPNVYAVLAAPGGAGEAVPGINEYIPEESVNEAVFANVFGEEESRYHFPANEAINPDGHSYNGSTPLDIREQSLHDVVPLLKEKGLVTIIETYTPLKAPLDEVKTMLEAAGLEVLFAIERDNPNDRNEFAYMLPTYGKNIGDARPGSYIIQAMKTTGETLMPLDDLLTYTEDGRVERTTSPYRLYEYVEDDGVLDIDTLVLLGVEDASPDVQLQALVDASEATLQDFSKVSGITVVPHEVREQDEHGSIIISAEKIEPTEATDEEKLDYIPGVVAYYGHVFSQFEDLARGRANTNVLYHTDLSKPSQYVFGSIEGQEPQNYFVDLDPELNTIATNQDGGWLLDEHFIIAVAELAAVSHGHMAGHEELVGLIDTFKHSRLVNSRQLRMIEYALQTGQAYTQDKQDLALR